MIKAYLSESPEEIPTTFFKYLKDKAVEHQVKVWSRKSTYDWDQHYAFLTLRDYNHLRKNNTLPRPDHLIILFTELASSDPCGFQEEIFFTGFISGDEDIRGVLAAEYYEALVNIKLGKKLTSGFPELSIQTGIEGVKKVWLKNKMEECLNELGLLGKISESTFEETPKHFRINVSMASKLSIHHFFGSFCTTSKDLSNISQEALALSKVISDSTKAFIVKHSAQQIKLSLVFNKTKSQSEFEKSPRLYGFFNTGKHD